LSSAQFPVLENFDSALSLLRKTVPGLKWEDNDTLASDILSARLRAKFYGTEVITYRPYLKEVMNRASKYPNNGSNQFSPVPQEEISENILNYCKLCIKALVNSTKVFYGMPKGQRLILTNVWGTAHA
jgi:hypothetical protein